MNRHDTPSPRWAIAFVALAVGAGGLLGMQQIPFTTTPVEVQSSCAGNNTPDTKDFSLKASLDTSTGAPFLVFNAQDSQGAKWSALHEISIVDAHGELVGSAQRVPAYDILGDGPASARAPLSLPDKPGYYTILVRTALLGSEEGVADQRLRVYVENGVMEAVTQQEYEDSSNANEARVLETQG